jgi:phosphatidylserine/phosphatidylglycerophosphate/cardiolipin synthase-like enzyme
VPFLQERLQRCVSEPLALHDMPNWGARDTPCSSLKGGRDLTPPATPKRGGERDTTPTTSPRSAMPPSPATPTPRRGAAATIAAEKHVRDADAMRTALHESSQKSLYESWEENERLRHEVAGLRGQMAEEGRRHQAHIREAVAAVHRMADGSCKVNLYWSGAEEEANSSWVDEAVSALRAARHCWISAMSPWVDSERITQALCEAAAQDRCNEVSILVDKDGLASGKPVAMKQMVWDMAEAGVNVRQARGQALSRLYTGPSFVGRYGTVHVKGLRIRPWKTPSKPGAGPHRLFVGSHNFTMAAEKTNIELMVELIQDVATDGAMIRWDEGFGGIWQGAEGAIGATDIRPSTPRRYTKKGPPRV